MKETHRFESAIEMQQWAESFAESLSGGAVLALVGDLGGGKTTFVQGLAKGLSADQSVTSPTFVLVKKLPLKKHSSAETLYHIDVYRLKDPRELEGIGWDDILEDKKGVVAIEWAERVKERIPPDAYWLKFNYINDQTREVVLSQGI